MCVCVGVSSVCCSAVRNRASYWAGSTRPTHPHHQPVSVPLSEKGELGHGVSRMQEGATLMKKAFDRVRQKDRGLAFVQAPYHTHCLARGIW